jgi:CRP-like cAMP-binding protein
MTVPGSGLSPKLAQPAVVAAMAGAAQRRKIATRAKPPMLWHQPSSMRMRDLRFDVFLHLPGRSELERLSVHRSQSLVCMQAALQRQFDIPFEQQRLFFHGEQLEGDDELCDYGLQDKSVVVLRVAPRFRRIGDVYSTIRTIRFPSPASRLEDFQVVDVPAGLPPLRVVFRRIVSAITYLTTLDRMQARHTHRRVWRQHVTFWDEPTAPAPAIPTQARVIYSYRRARPRRSLMQEQVALPSEHKKDASYVLQTSSTEHVASILALATAHGVQQRLQRPPASRSSADMRNLKRWLSSLKYFADARLPDAIFQELARTSTYVRVSSGEFVFRQGEAGDSFYVLITGCVSLAAYSTGFFRTLTPGSCFGEISLIEPLGLRTASACVTFATAWAELAVVSGDLYRRAIKPYKQVVLRATEKAIASIPRMHALPPHIITHVAYAARSLTAREGRHIICRGEEISVLVLLVQGAVKVSKPPLRGKPIVAVVQAPAVFGQEGALATTTSPAPWEIVALDTCALLCLRKDTIASFLSPLHDVVRALMGEHHQRLREFSHRFYPDSNVSSRELPHEGGSSRSASVHMNDGPAFVGDATPRPATRNQSIVFPHVLAREETQRRLPAASRLDELARPVTTDDRELSHRPRRPRKRPASQPSATSSPSCAELEAQYLSRVLPFSGIVSLPEQLRYASFDQQHRQEPDSRPPDEHDAEDSKTTALLNGLRWLPPQDVQLLPVVCPASPLDRARHYRFAPLPPTRDEFKQRK